MKIFLSVFVFLLCTCGVARADVWMWVDANGNTHFVDTMKPIYTWKDETGRVHYSDTPDHEGAVRVELVWYSSGTLDEEEKTASTDGYAHPGETAEERHERERAEAYYCKRATEIYESYLKAPDLYKTNEAGERVFLTEEERERTIAETLAKKDAYCG